MKDLLDQYAKYNAWAHKRLMATINTLDDWQHHKEIVSSFSSLYNTVFHVFGAETVWMERFNNETGKRPDDIFNGSMAAVSAALEKVDEQLSDWIMGKSENDLKENLHYSNLRGDKFYQPYEILVMHVLNHGTYHNGQLVTMLRQLKVEKIPETDFVAFTRL